MDRNGDLKVCKAKADTCFTGLALTEICERPVLEVLAAGKNHVVLSISTPALSEEKQPKHERRLRKRICELAKTMQNNLAIAKQILQEYGVKPDTDHPVLQCGCRRIHASCTTSFWRKRGNKKLTKDDFTNNVKLTKIICSGALLKIIDSCLDARRALPEKKRSAPTRDCKQSSKKVRTVSFDEDNEVANVQHNFDLWQPEDLIPAADPGGVVAEIVRLITRDLRTIGEKKGIVHSLQDESSFYQPYADAWAALRRELSVDSSLLIFSNRVEKCRGHLFRYLIALHKLFKNDENNRENILLHCSPLSRCFELCLVTYRAATMKCRLQPWFNSGDRSFIEKFKIISAPTIDVEVIDFVKEVNKNVGKFGLGKVIMGLIEPQYVSRADLVAATCATAVGRACTDAASPVNTKIGLAVSIAVGREHAEASSRESVENPLPPSIAAGRPPAEAANPDSVELGLAPETAAYKAKAANPDSVELGLAPAIPMTYKGHTRVTEEAQEGVAFNTEDVDPLYFLPYFDGDW